GISGTPTFFINGRKIEESENVTTLDAFSKLIDAELASNQSSN
ncbi:thioredoxin domain-containing protein, partial [Candidatus Saccharibacteria bacterium]|nr:thioredoxin domain-containing protein [Candidatus Saccharibacteria bacterium]